MFASWVPETVELILTRPAASDPRLCSARVPEHPHIAELRRSDRVVGHVHVAGRPATPMSPPGVCDSCDSTVTTSDLTNPMVGLIAPSFLSVGNSDVLTDFSGGRHPSATNQPTIIIPRPEDPTLSV